MLQITLFWSKGFGHLSCEGLEFKIVGFYRRPVHVEVARVFAVIRFHLVEALELQ